MATGVGLVLVKCTRRVRILPQAIQVRHRNLGQASVFVLAELAELTLENLARGRTAEGVVGFIHRRQPRRVGARVTRGKTATPVHRLLHLAPVEVLAD